MPVMSVEYAQQRIKDIEKMMASRSTSLAYLDPITLADLGGCYFTLNRPEEALALTKYASERCKDPGIQMNRGLIHKDLGQHPQSLHEIEEAFWLNSSDIYTRLGYAEGLLRAGFWKQAWPLYQHARPTQQGAHDDLRLPPDVQEWKGGPLSVGHKVIVINEGGTGDRISYARWLPVLTQLGIDWVFYPYDELFPFFERIFPRERLIKDGDKITATHWATTFSLPAILDVGPTQVPIPLPITALPEKIEKYKYKRADSVPVVGICYQAAEMFQGGRRVRSMSEGQAMRLICSTSDVIRWVSLQYGTVLPYPVTNIKLENWEDTAGLIANLDGVVTVDTSIMHLAGAMGKKTATLLSGNSCWKFLAKGKRCPWYPTATLFRNETVGFENSINAVINAIRNESFFPSVQ